MQSCFFLKKPVVTHGGSFVASTTKGDSSIIAEALDCLSGREMSEKKSVAITTNLLIPIDFMACPRIRVPGGGASNLKDR